MQKFIISFLVLTIVASTLGQFFSQPASAPATRTCPGLLAMSSGARCTGGDAPAPAPVPAPSNGDGSGSGGDGSGSGGGGGDDPAAEDPAAEDPAAEDPAAEDPAAGESAKKYIH